LDGSGGVLGLGVVQASHVRDETGLRSVQVGHDHSVVTGVCGGSSAVKSIISDFGIALGIGLVVDEDFGLVDDFAGVDSLGGRDATPRGIKAADVEAILLGPAFSS